MSDLISSLADSILALINAKPQSPTKDEVARLLQSYLFVEDEGRALYKLPGQTCKAPPEDESECLLWPDRMEAGLLKALEESADDIRKSRAYFEEQRERGRRLMGLPPETEQPPLSTAHQTIFDNRTWQVRSQALVDAMNTSVYGGPTIDDRDKYWANKLNEPFRDMPPTIAVGQADRPCPGSTDGKHDWSAIREPNATDAFRCPCGARCSSLERVQNS